MGLILERGEKQVWMEELDQVDSFSLPFPQAPYACMVWASQAGVVERDRSRLADALIATGCRYIVCGGEECEMWHDSADDAYLAVDPELNNHVMTTWHKSESEEDVMFFLLTCTAVENVILNRYLIIQVGRNEKRSEAFSTLVSKIASAEWAA